MFATSFLACGQGLGLAVPALQRSLQHLLCLQNSSSSSAAAFASKAKAEPPYKKDKPQGASKKKQGAIDKPPRAISAYAYFIKDQVPGRKGEDGLSASGLMKKIAGEWKTLQDHQKQPYVELAAKSKAGVAEVRSAKKSARGPPTAYNIFCGEVAADIRARNENLAGPDLMREVAGRWATLPAAEKEKRKADAQAAKDAWKAQQL